MTSRTAFLLLALASFGCRAAPPYGSPPPAVGEELDADERAVIAAVLDRELGDAPVIVVAESTLVWPAGEGWSTHILQWVRRVDPVRLDQAIRDYSVRNQAAAPLPADLPTARPARIFPHREFQRLEHQERINGLQATFPGATSYHRVSRPGFDAARDVAIVYTVMSCEGRCGRGGVTVLHRQASGWAVQGFAEMGVRGVTRAHLAPSPGSGATGVEGARWSASTSPAAVGGS